MARAYGWNSQLLFAFESTYGTDPGGNFRKLPFVSLDFGADQGLIEDDLLGLGRDPQAPTSDLMRVTGSITVPIDLRNIGYWLKLLFGAPTTTGASAPYTHVFVSGASSLLSASLEVGLPQVPSFAQTLGVRANGFRVDFARSGKPVMVIDLIGQDEDLYTTTQGGTPPTEHVVSRFNAFQGSVERNATALGNIETASCNFTNNLESIETLRDDALIEAADPGICAGNGDLSARFADTTLLDDAVNETEVDLDFNYYIDASNNLEFSYNRVRLPRGKRSITGPGGVTVPFSWQAAQQTNGDEMLTVTLLCDVDDFVNPT